MSNVVDLLLTFENHIILVNMLKMQLVNLKFILWSVYIEQNLRVQIHHTDTRCCSTIRFANKDCLSLVLFITECNMSPRNCSICNRLCTQIEKSKLFKTKKYRNTGWSHFGYLWIHMTSRHEIPFR